MVYCFEATIASRGFHVYKETTWSNAKVGDEVKVEVKSNLKSILHDPYSCTLKTKHEYYIGWKIVVFISREISQYVYLFIKQKCGRVYGKLKSLKYKPSPIKTKHEYYIGWKIVVLISREISQYVYLFIKQKCGRVYGKLKSLKYKPSPIKTKHEYYIGWKIVGHISREISQYVYLFIKQEGDRVYGKLKSLKYKPSPILSDCRKFGSPAVT